MDTKTLAELRARDVMTADVVSVSETTSVRELVSLLREHDVSGAPVVDEGGKLVGVVSATDAAAASEPRASVAPEVASPEFYVHGWEDKLNPDELRQLHVEDEGLLVSDIMTPIVYTVASDAAIPELARTMIEAHVHRLLVTEDEDLVGIVSTMDLLRLLAEE